MNSDIVEKINHLLNEEKWTRAAISSYSVENFKELDAIIGEISDDETKAEVLKNCDEHLARNRNSIIGLYISGIITLSRNQLDDSSMMQLESMFTEAGKWNVAEYLCNRMLEFGNNKAALKELADCYESEGKEDEKLAVWERLIKADQEETDIVKTLAEKYEADGDIEKAIEYYKNAIRRYAHKKQFNNVVGIWKKIIEIDPDDIEFFNSFLKKASRTVPVERLPELMDTLYLHYKANKDWDNAISILKELIALDSKLGEVRKEIIECFTAKYGDLPHFQKALNDSNLSQSWRPINDAISDFEKHISFAKGNFVFHSNWGIGQIADIKDENIVINFIKKKGHKMDSKMAVNALSILPKNHIWVIKCTHKLPELKKMVKEDVAGTLKTIIKSFDNCADLKRIKAELCPGILSANEWTSWSTEAKKVLKTNPEFGNLPEKEDFYEVRVKPIKFEEKIYNRFKSQEKFFDKYITFHDYCKDGAEENDSYAEMLGYFESFLKLNGNADEKVICSWLLLEKIGSKLNESFADIFSRIADVQATFRAIPERQTELRKEFLEKVKISIPEWSDIYCQLFPCYLSSFIPGSLMAEGYTEKVKAVFKKILDDFKTYRESYVWICKNGGEYDFFQDLKPAEEKVLTDMLHLLDIINREIANKKNAPANRKIGKQIEQYLFKDNRLEDFLMSADQKKAKLMISLMEGVANLNPNIVPDFKKKLKAKYPEIVFDSERPMEIISRSENLVTEAGMARKQKELKNILEVELPKTAKEIGEAIALGDLSENAEYKFGKEKQEMLNNAAKKLKEEIDKAQVFDKSKINLNKVSFGTKATMLNLDTDQNVVYTILGPWESEPEKNIISYKAPLGIELLDAEKDEELHFEINGTKYDLKVLAIEASDLI